MLSLKGHQRTELELISIGFAYMVFRFLPLLALNLLVVTGVAGHTDGAFAADRWVRIVQHRIDRDRPEEIIDLRDARGSFVGFQVRARRGTVAVDRYTLNFHDGTKYEGEEALRLRPGRRSSVIARGDAERFLDSLLVRYPKGVRRSRSARLELWGLQTGVGRGAKRPEKLMPVPPPPPRVGDVELENPGSVLITAQEVGREVKQETIEVAQQLGKFKQLRLAARGSDVLLDKLSIEFADGSKKDYAVKGKLQPHTSSPWFDIDGSKFISKVNLQFREPTSLSSPTRIEIYGIQSDGWISRYGEGGKFNDGWVLLGAKPAGFVGFDSDVIPVSKDATGFAKIRINDRNRAITLNQLRVKYSNGEEDIVPVRARIDAGNSFGPIDLRSGPPKVREIEARYRSRVIDQAMKAKGAAVVQIWAKR